MTAPNPPAAAPPPAPLALQALSRLLGALPVGSGQHRVVRRIYETRLRDLSPPVFARTRLRPGVLVELDLTDYTQAQAFLTRRYDPALTAFIRRRLPPGGTYVDVGGHIGLVALAIARSRCDARVVVLEPHPDNRRRLRANAGLNPDAAIEIDEAAAGRAEGSARLSNVGEGTDYHRIVEGDEAESIEIAVRALDEVARARRIESVDVLKLDVEGHEAEALAGARDLLSTGRIGTVICELNDDLLGAVGSSSELLEAEMRGHGYRRERIPPVGLHRLHRPSVPYENWAFVSDGERARPPRSLARERRR